MLATVNADGQPQVTPVWCDRHGNEIWVNSAKIVDANLDELADKYSESIPGLKRNSGRIGLQNHGSPVSFRNLRVRKLDE